MIKFNNIIKTETYIELDAEDGGKMYMPASATIFVDDNSNAISVKTTGSRKTIGVVISGGTPPVPPVPPTFEGKWKATYADSHTASAECGGSSAITENEIPDKANVVSVEIGDCVVSIGTSAFRSCSSLTSVTIPNGVTTIGEDAFLNCYSLSSVAISDSVTTIGNGAFQYCSGLTSCTIGSGVTYIDKQAFKDCESLTSITVNATTPPTLNGSYVFSGTNDCPIYVPASSVDAYKTANKWSAYADRIQPIV